MTLTTIDRLAGVEMFAGLDSRTRLRLVARAEEVRYRRGQVLFAEGDPSDALVVLCGGAVAVYRTAPGGARVTLAVQKAPDVLGEVTLFDGACRSASVAALDDTIALWVPRPALLALMQSHPAMLEAVLRQFGTLVRRLTDQTSDHVFLDLSGRVAKALLRLSVDDPVRGRRSVEVTQSMLAEMVGGSRQSVNQAIRCFTHRGWVRHEGRLLVLDDLTALRRRAGLERHPHRPGRGPRR